METINYLKDLLKHELKDLYSAETQLVESLPKMISRASNKQLKGKLNEHYIITKEHVKRLDRIQELLNKEDDVAQKEETVEGFFANLFKRRNGKEHCKAMEGLIKEGKKIMKEDMPDEVMDAAIIAAAQKIEHYEISSYGTAKAFALQVGMKQVAQLLDETLQEEHAADNGLTKLALSKVNEAADGGAEQKEAEKTSSTKAIPDTNKKEVPVKKAAKKPAPKKASPKKASPKKAAAKK